VAQDLDALVVELSEANGLVSRKTKAAPHHNAGRQHSAEPGPADSLRTELEGIKQTVKSLQSEAVLRAELDGARQLIKSLQDQIKDLRIDRDGWRQLAQSTQRP
jgi:hypothetical protein